MTRRSRVPSEVTDPEHQSFLDKLDKRKRAAIANLDGAATLPDVIAKINEILQADRNSGQQES